MKITNDIIESHGLKLEEYSKIKLLLNREPNFLELGIFSAMWNEHCSYKSSKVHLKKLPVKNKNVIQGPGENAGVIDIGDDDAIVFKIESHNHPSFIEPYQGAATGVGGILRDVFTMGARPIALLNSIHFGDPKNKKTKNLLNGVVSGIGGYGNCIGIPTVAGETKFNSTYNENILVNAMAVGLANKKKIFYSKAKGINKPVVYVGSKTGRDGIHGASMASAEFDENTEEKKPTVQVGDPFTEKLLMEACLELMKKDSIISIQDMGAAGLTSSSVEMAYKGNLGIELYLDKVPCREENMSPYEMMLSESQERMLIILEDGKENEAKKIFNKWDLDFVVIGKTTDSKDLSLKYNNKTVATIPIEALSSKAPLYDRKWTKKKLDKKKINLKDLKKIKFDDAFFKIISSPNQSNKNWVTEQFDQMVMGDTIERSGTNAAVVKIHGKEKAIAVTVDSSANYCKSHPLSGGKQIVCESWRNLVAVGAKPIAITNCLNFGNPENPEIMGQFAENVLGIKEACEFLNYPVVSGNVSFYNGTNKNNIFPTPVIGGVGLINNINKIQNHKFKKIDSQIILIGKTFGHIDQSVFINELYNLYEGMPPEVNLLNEKNNGDIVLKLINAGNINSVHDVSVGGIILALAEMSLSSNIGVKINKPKKLSNLFNYFFGEDQSRYLVEVDKSNYSNVEKILKDNNIYFDNIGVTQKEYFELDKVLKINVKELYELNNRWYNNYNGLNS
ncbi:MAG: phosphoribosylformylglycinamidine synthase II [Candidatus Pelagibacter sp.]|nr:phosphoribosylformylglycinamidine synthase II [Candidatus Pelagibacter sp.]OUW67669.1 MAG: phosphoribosylformylglycinamidine synthase II [Candidatus Pelagibacter sp. TMED202]|tara:strand:+ start:3000 stop:5195 length:2196 start_codon:yes stop_codon:yes gene_type:complete